MIKADELRKTAYLSAEQVEAELKRVAAQGSTSAVFHKAQLSDKVQQVLRDNGYRIQESTLGKDYIVRWGE